MMAEGRDRAIIRIGAVLLMCKSATMKDTMVIILLTMLKVERMIWIGLVPASRLAFSIFS